MNKNGTVLGNSCNGNEIEDELLKLKLHNFLNTS